MGTSSGKSYSASTLFGIFRGHGSTPAETGTGIPLGLPPMLPQSNIIWAAWAFLHQTRVTPAFLDRRTLVFLDRRTLAFLDRRTLT